MADFYWTAVEWGAYDRKTAHLSLAQDGAYRRLLSHYYQTRKPLPTNTETLMRVCRAFDESEKAAVLSVLGEFFTLESDGYHNQRADEELSRSASIVQARSKGGQARASMLNPEQRSEIAKKAAVSRWKINDLQENMPANMLAECLQDASQLQLQSQKNKQAFTPLEAARGFQSEFLLTGNSILRAAEQAITLRCSLSKSDPQEACSQIQREYRAYLDSKPEFQKGPEKWLSQCNQGYAPPPAPKKWKVLR